MNNIIEKNYGISKGNNDVIENASIKPQKDDSFIEKVYGISKEKSNIKTEIAAGVTTFITVSYIIAINSSILNTAGMPYEAVAISTILASLVGCLLMSFLANSPLALVPGMGDNAFFVFTLVGSFGFNWRQALAVVFFAGIIFFMTSATKISSLLISFIPKSLVSAMSAGIGLFIAFLGLKNGGIIDASKGTFVKLANLSSPTALTTIITLLIILALYLRNVKGSFLIGILSGTFIGYLFGIVKIDSLNWTPVSLNGYGRVFLAFDFSKIFTINFWIAVFSLSMLIIFQNMGAQISMLPNKEKFSKSFLANSISVICTAIFGSSSTTTAAEGSTGIAVGGKTGLTSLVTGLLFIPAIFLMPIFKIIPMSAVSPILIIVGCLMVSYNIKDISFEDFTEAFPAYLMLTIMPLSFNIANGIAFGFVVYPLLKIITGKRSEVSTPMYILLFLFLAYLILGVK